MKGEILYANTDDSTLLHLGKRSIFDRWQIYACDFISASFAYLNQHFLCL